MNKLPIISGVVAAAVVFLGSLSFVVVDAGYVGVVKRLGAVQPNFLSEGFHVKTPIIDSVEKFDIRLSKSQHTWEITGVAFSC